MEQQKSNNTVLWIIISALVTIIVIGIIGVIVFFFVLQKNSDESKINTVQPTPTPTAVVTNTPITTQDMTVEGDSPTDVTENFIVYTLGTVPGAELDYDKARLLMSKAHQAEFTEDSFIPQFYGIQDGPDTYEMKIQAINGNDASVKVDVLYGEMMLGWAFMLVKEDGQWKIDGIRKDAQ